MATKYIKITTALLVKIIIFLFISFGNLVMLIQFLNKHPARAGTLAGWFQQGCGMMVALLLIPVVTRFLSPHEAGIWFAFQGLVTMIGLLDLGFGFAISRQAAFTIGSTETTLAKDDFLHLAQGWTGVAQLFRLTHSLYRWLAIAAAGLGIVVFEVISRFGNLLPDGTPGVRACWYAMAAASCLLILTAGHSAFLNGIGAVYQTRLLAGLYQLAAGAGAASAAWAGWGLPAMGASFAVCAVAYRVVIGFFWHAYTHPMREVAEIAPAPGSLGRLARAALPVGGVNVFASLIYTIQSPMLGFLLGPEKVAPFYLAQKIAMACNMLAMQTALPQLPFFTRAYGSGDNAQAFTNFQKTVLHTSVFVIIAALGFYFFSPDAASILLHQEKYIDQYTLFLMTLDLMIMGCSTIWGQYVLASGKNPFVVTTLLNGISSLCASCFLVPILGLAGLPTATLIAGFAFNYRKCISEGLRLYKLTRSPQ
jgi:O-antigen/teichoic acid export membrane protein